MNFPFPFITLSKILEADKSRGTHPEAGILAARDISRWRVERRCWIAASDPDHEEEMSSHSRLMAQFQSPKFHTPGKRKQDDKIRGQAGSSTGSSDKKRRVAQESTCSDSNSSDDEECIPMSESQLNRHSKTSSEVNVEKIPDSSEILESRLKRIAMKSRTAQHKENRLYPTTSQGGSSNQPHRTGPPKTDTRYVLCMWRAPQMRKHKTWDGDACLILGSSNKLIDTKNKHM